MKTTWRQELVQLVPIAAMFVTAALAWSHVPERMPVHWNVRGEVDGYGGRFVGLALLPLAALGVYCLTALIPFCDPGRANYRNFAGAYQAIRLTITLFLSAIYAVGVLWALGHPVNMTTVVGLGLGVMFIVFGNVMGKIRPNWFCGIRTPWTLSSKDSWTKTHRLAGWLFIAMGLIAAAWGIWPTVWMFGLMLAFDAACLVWMFVYSYLIYRGDPNRTAPAGTSPVEERAG